MTCVRYRRNYCRACHKATEPTRNKNGEKHARACPRMSRPASPGRVRRDDLRSALPATVPRLPEPRRNDSAPGARYIYILRYCPIWRICVESLRRTFLAPFASPPRDFGTISDGRDDGLCSRSYEQGIYIICGIIPHVRNSLFFCL